MSISSSLVNHFNNILNKSRSKRQEIVTGNNSSVSNYSIKASQSTSKQSAFSISEKNATDSINKTNAEYLKKSERLKDVYYYCERGAVLHGAEVNLDEGCLAKKKKIAERAFFNLGQKLPQAKIIAKNVYELEGTAYECRITRLQRYSFENFFGIGTQDSLSKQSLELYENQCWQMILTKQCITENNYKLNMTCDRLNHCSVDTTPKPDYKWMTEYVRNGFICQTQPLPLFVRNRSEPLFGIQGCYGHLGFCRTDNSIIVWRKELAQKCPYAVIDQSDLEVGFEPNQENILNDPLNQHAFQVTGTMEVCQSRVYTTSQGLYILPKEENFLVGSEQLNHTQLDTLHELILSEIDGHDLKLSRALDVIRKRFCEQLLESLTRLSKLEDTYRILTNSRGEEIVFYATNGKVYKPRCVPVDSMSFIGHGKQYNKLCPADMEVLFSALNSTDSSLSKGFLTKQKVISAFSPLTRDCSLQVSRTYAINNQIVVQRGDKFSFIDMPANRISVIDVDDESFIKNMRHYQALKEDIDIISGLASTKLLSDFLVEIKDAQLVQPMEQKQILRGLAYTISDGAKYFASEVKEIYTDFLSIATLIKLGLLTFIVVSAVVFYIRFTGKKGFKMPNPIPRRMYNGVSQRSGTESVKMKDLVRKAISTKKKVQFNDEMPALEGREHEAFSEEVY